MRRLLTVALAVLVAAPIGVLAAPDSAAASDAWSPTVHPHDVADPDIVAGPDGQFYVYATNVNVWGTWINTPVLSSPDLRTWTFAGDALPTLPGWAQGGLTWAPGVDVFGSSWNLYFTARHRASGRQCIGVATAPSPTGPFTDGLGRPLGGSIDPDTVRSADGRTWLLWKSDENAFDIFWYAPGPDPESTWWGGVGRRTFAGSAGPAVSGRVRPLPAARR